MICPHCRTAAFFEWKSTGLIKQINDLGIALSYASCPSCDKLVVTLDSGPLDFNDDYPQFLYDHRVGDLTSTDQILYPTSKDIFNSKYIPSKHYNDYEESYKVIGISPKASAALNRRVLQNILREHFGIKKRNLCDEIETFIHMENIPSHITDAVDAVRNIGNIAAHPIKNQTTGEIVEVEPGEAEWLLEVIEALFDFCFIQPEKIKKRRNELNEKLKSLGKPDMK
ncbi:DUF4145 domain-containing protein [Saccharicrinis aurantiacus]|uniref:DUF4145 domain-containing protein n=1 Tax=Saccharicrinis aurantiacus TaxID=1849719 RepID=UPI002491E946|nr:DUF4145 domain-containing protein [Saccharicrinis aurantiacus]